MNTTSSTIYFFFFFLSPELHIIMWRTPVYRNVQKRIHQVLTRQRTAIVFSKHTAVVPYLTFQRAYASSSSNSSSAGDYYNQSKEDEEDKVLEEEEFAALREGEDDEFMPLTHRLAHKADALDAELRRLRYTLCDQPQFLVDTAAATFLGRPTDMKAVIDLLLAAPKSTGITDAASGAASRNPEKPKTSHAASTTCSSSGNSASGGRFTSVLSPKLEAALRSSPYGAWTGTSAPVARLLCQRIFWPRSKTADAAASASSHGTELATMDADLDYLRRARALHQLNYYSRLNLTPKRHIWLALYQILWNLLIAAQNACGCVVYGALRGVKERGMVAGLCTGALTGAGKGLVFLAYGWVLSPLLHLSRGLCNSLYGPVNAVTGRYMFDAISGRWMQCTVADTVYFRHALQREKRVLRTIGRAEFRRKRMKVEHKWSARMASMGFSVESFAEKMKAGKAKRGGRDAGASAKAEEKLRNPYEVLQVRRTASAQEIKKQYKKLAMVFHPDVAQSRQGGSLSAEEKAAAQHKFEEIANAYQILSNPEKRKAYDMGGAQGVHLHETKYGKFMSRTPEEMVQSIFGGEGFRRMLVGELLRSHWALRYEAQVSVSIHELEELQCIRVRQLAMELAAIADVHARRPTTPYYGGAFSASTAAAAGHAQSGTNAQRRNASALRGGLSSSLPDYLKSGKPRSRAAAAGLGGRPATAGAGAGAGKGIEKEMHDSIMEELGGGRGGASTSSAAGAGGGASAASSRLGGRKSADAAADLSARSPFVLHPGSNEYNCFSRDFEDRCDKFVRYLAEACFGKQLLYEVGEAYVVNAQRFLGIRPFYASKALVTRKIFTGMDRVYDAFKDKTKLNKQQVAHKVVAEYFNIEYDSVVADIHAALRYALQMVLQDAVESEEVRRKRCYAVWLLGEKMMAVGERWTSRITKDEDLNAYIQQAANSVATTSKPPAF